MGRVLTYCGVGRSLRTVVVLVLYVDAVTVMRVLFVLHVCMLRECEGTKVLVWGMEVWL